MTIHKKTLVELTTEVSKLEAAVVELGGELPPELERDLDGLLVQQGEKIDSYSFILQRTELLETFWRAESEKMANIARGLQKLQERMRARIRDVMREQGLDELQGDSVRFKLVQSAPSLEVVNTAEVPWEYIRMEPVLDKARIKEALKNGTAVPGAVLKSGWHVRPYYMKKDVKND